MAIVFNSYQQDYMKYLASLKPEEKCYCAWYRVGECYNCPKEATLTDRLKVQCPSCRNYPEYGKTEMTHNIMCKIK